MSAASCSPACATSCSTSTTKLNIVPQLATGYEWADDKTLVIHLRAGVKFQDGEVLDAGGGEILRWSAT